MGERDTNVMPCLLVVLDEVIFGIVMVIVLAEGVHVCPGLHVVVQGSKVPTLGIVLLVLGKVITQTDDRPSPCG